MTSSGISNDGNPQIYLSLDPMNSLGLTFCFYINEMVLSLNCIIFAFFFIDKIVMFGSMKNIFCP